MKTSLSPDERANPGQPAATTTAELTRPGAVQAILIDPVAQIVQPVTIPDTTGSLQDLVATATGFTSPWFIAFGLYLDRLYVERNDYLITAPGFLYGTLPLFGKCLIIGREDKAELFTDCKGTVEETLLHIRFLDESENITQKSKRKKMHH